MEKLKNWLNTQGGEKYARIAAICRVCLLVIYFIVLIVLINQGFSVALASYSTLIVDLVMAVSLFKMNKKVLIAIEGFFTLGGIIDLISAFALIIFGSFTSIDVISVITQFLSLSACIATIVVTAMSLKGNNNVKKIWFIPAVAALLSNLIIQFSSWSWTSLLTIIVSTCMNLSIGLWLKNDITPKRIKSTEAFGGADKLKMYKELLDTGVITQQDYDAKRKEILGL